MPEPTFVPEYPLADLKPADYNPRRISPEAFAKLRTSLRTYGVCKPIILNRDGTIVAGHQRTKSMHAEKFTHTPAVVLGVKAAREDEIRFNLMHNSVETSTSPARLVNPLSLGYAWADGTDVEGTVVNGEVVKSCASLLARYGAYGSVVATPDGTIVVNSEYALACRTMGKPVLVYTISDEQTPGFLAALAEDYGEYHYAPLGIKAYNQLQCQLNRLRGKRNADGDLLGNSKDMLSHLYEELVLPYLTTQPERQRIVDFGSGHGDYAKRLNAEGLATVLPYEPHLQPKGSRKIDVRAVVMQLVALGSDVRAHGLYPVTVLDSVLNSLTSLEFEEAVLASCNALTVRGGMFFTCARNKRWIDKRAVAKRSASSRRMIEFLDRDNFSATYRDGMWTMQHFHTKDGLRDLLLGYFAEVETIEKGTMIHARARGPLPLGLDRYRAALDLELNMELPGGFRHGRHEPTRDAILSYVMARDENR